MAGFDANREQALPLGYADRFPARPDKIRQKAKAVLQSNPLLWAMDWTFLPAQKQATLDLLPIQHVRSLVRQSAEEVQGESRVWQYIGRGVHGYSNAPNNQAGTLIWFLSLSHR